MPVTVGSTWRHTRTVGARTPQGQLLFFHKTVFTAFDKDANGTLDQSELDAFLDTFYKSGSIFAGDARLPPKEELKKRVNDTLDNDGDGVFTFEEIHSLISGQADLKTKAGDDRQST